MIPLRDQFRKQNRKTVRLTELMLLLSKLVSEWNHFSSEWFLAHHYQVYKISAQQLQKKGIIDTLTKNQY